MSSQSHVPSVPAVIGDAAKSSYLVFMTFVVMFIGVGQLSSRAGLDAVQTAVMTAFTLAAPAQAAAVSILLSAGGSAGAAWVTAVMAVLLINLRFIVMVASVMARLPRISIPRMIATLIFLSASSFAVVFPRLVDDPPKRPVLYVFSVCALCCISAVIGAVLGHRMSATVSPLLGALLGAVIPVYFTALLAAQWKKRVLMLNAAADAVLVPLGTPFLGSTSLLVIPLAVAAVTVLWDRRKKHV